MQIETLKYQTSKTLCGATSRAASLIIALSIICSLTFATNAQQRRRRSADKKNAAAASVPTHAPDKADTAAQDKVDKATPINTDSSTPAADASTQSATRDGAPKTDLNEIIRLPPQERVDRLRAFIKSQMDAALKLRARELLVSARAALGDEKLKAGDARGGREEFQRAVEEAPAEMSDRLYAEVVSRLPLNLFLRNEQAAALSLARTIETKVKDDPKRLLLLAGFYLSIEQSDEAARVSELAVKLAPDNPAAHRALGASRQIALNLDDAATEYARALELDVKSQPARRSLADLRRATNKPEEALALYREVLQSDPADKSARAGMVLALFDSRKKEDAERELAAALKDEPRNLPLLVGAAYWYAAHEDGAHALDLATRAVGLEPRYTWAQIAFARALILQKQPLAAEQALRAARSFGNFPTLDYELANALAAAGLYEEAATQLKNSFTLRDNKLETKLAGRIPARAASFTELLAPERRASIFAFTAADSEAGARMLKALLAFNTMLGSSGGKQAIDEAAATQAAQEFAAGEDSMHAYRQLYAATRLLQNSLAPQLALDLTNAATIGVEAALDAPTATVAVLADDIAVVRAQAIAAGTAPPFPVTDRSTLSNILRGRIEDTAGRALLNQNKPAAAVARLRRAISVLPENSVWWRNALWRLGGALEQTGNPADALAAYLKSYKNGSPDILRRAVLEALYRKVNGSLEGLDAQLGTASFVEASDANASPAGNQSLPASEGATEQRPNNSNAAKRRGRRARQP